MDTYLSISQEAEGTYKDKGSKFLAFAFPCETEEEVKFYLDSLRKKYFDATHHCYAFRLGFLGEKYRANDDGEPNGSAGLPIFMQLKSKNLTNILVVVVRYYGGTKLGVSGLIHAYKEATLDALANVNIETKIIFEKIKVNFVYEKMNYMMSAIKKYDLTILNQTFAMECMIEVKVRKSNAAIVFDLFQEHGEAIYVFDEHK